MRRTDRIERFHKWSDAFRTEREKTVQRKILKAQKKAEEKQERLQEYSKDNNMETRFMPVIDEESPKREKMQLFVRYFREEKD